MLRELVRHRQKVARDLNGVFESQRVVCPHTADETLAHAQLPQHGSKPLLSDAKIRCLAFGAVEIRRQCFRELVLELRHPRWIAVRLDFVPHVDDGIIDGLVQVEKTIEPR